MSASAVVAGVAIAAAAFAGGYALAHGEPAADPPGQSPPAAVTLAKDQLPDLGKARPLPKLAAPAPPPTPDVEPDEEEPDSEPLEPEQSVAPVTPAPAPTPTPAPAPAPSPSPSPSPPANFDDSG